MIGPAKSQGHEGQEGIENWVRGSVEWEQWVPIKRAAANGITGPHVLCLLGVENGSPSDVLILAPTLIGGRNMIDA